MSERLMFDSTTPWDIPRDAKMIAYYVDGKYAWPQAWLDMFPLAQKVSISAIGVKTAHVGDVEVGCIWPPRTAVPWVLRARADGYDPTIYVNELNDWGPVRQAFRDAGVPEPHYWVARYNGVRSYPEGSIGRQFAHPHDGDGVADRPWETGKHYDLSIIAPYWPGVDDGGLENMTEEQMKKFADMIADSINERVLWSPRYGDEEAERNLVDAAIERTNRTISLSDGLPVVAERLGQVVNLLDAILKGQKG